MFKFRFRVNMSKIYDSWEKLVGAVLNREELKRLALCQSFSTSSSVSSSRPSNFSDHDIRVQPVEYREILKATKNFRPDLYIGEGIFCQVYKAWVDEHTLTASKPGSGMAVAVKKWESYSRDKHQDWVKEIYHLTELRHPNLVELVGYCSDEDNMILVYKFVGNGTLDDHLFRRHQPLPWKTRIKVAIDVASGLSYLHDREVPIIHRDLKPANILLDEEFNAKLSNYCYGRDDPCGETSHASTDQLLLTYGYDAPELEGTGHLTTKYNVYTLGVVLLELLFGCRAHEKMQQIMKEELSRCGVHDTLQLTKKEQSLVDQMRPYLGDETKILRFMDRRLKGIFCHTTACEVAKIALQCLSLDLKLRPTMAEVLVALQQL